MRRYRRFTDRQKSCRGPQPEQSPPIAGSVAHAHIGAPPARSTVAQHGHSATRDAMHSGVRGVGGVLAVRSVSTRIELIMARGG